VQVPSRVAAERHAWRLLQARRLSRVRSAASPPRSCRRPEDFRVRAGRGVRRHGRSFPRVRDSADRRRRCRRREPRRGASRSPPMS